MGIATSAWTAWPHATGEGGTAIAPGPLNEAYSPMEVRREVGDEARGTTGAVLGAWEPPWAPSWALAAPSIVMMAIVAVREDALIGMIEKLT